MPRARFREPALVRGLGQRTEGGKNELRAVCAQMLSPSSRRWQARRRRAASGRLVGRRRVRSRASAGLCPLAARSSSDARALNSSLEPKFNLGSLAGLGKARARS